MHMKMRAKGWLLVLALLLIAALVPTVAGAAGSEITQIKINSLTLPYVHTEVPYHVFDGHVHSFSGISFTTTTAGGTISGPQACNSASTAWYNATTGIELTEYDRTIDPGYDYYLQFTAMGPGSDDYFKPSFHQSSIDMSSLAIRPYKIELGTPGSGTTKWLEVKLYFHSINNYSKDGDSGFPNMISFGTTGIFAPQVFDGEKPSTEATIDTYFTRATDFTVSNIQWHPTDDLSRNVTVFDSDHNYVVTCDVSTVDGYAVFGGTDLSIFKDYLAIIAGGVWGQDTNINVEWVTPGKTIRITYYPETAKKIATVTLGGIETPVVGGMPQTVGFKTEKKGINVHLYKWLDANGQAFTGPFEIKDTYDLWLKLETAAGYTFSSTMTVDNVDIGDCGGTLMDLRGNAFDGPGTDEGEGVRYVWIRFKTGMPADPETPSTPTTPTTGTQTSADGSTYHLPGDGTASFVAPAGSSSTVTIPPTITVGGTTVTVTAIADGAFSGNKKITTVTIGKNVKTIGKKAFMNCTKLKTVKGGAAVKTIKDSAFSGCKVLKTFPAMGKLQTIGANAFKGCAKLPKFTLGAAVKSIGKNAFNGCKALKTITVKTTKLTSSNVKAGAFKGIYSKATFKCPKAKLKDYKTLFVKKGAPKTCRFK